MTTKPYRPSNGIEGEMFIESWCWKCERDKHEDCDILARTFAYDIDEPEYPVQWVCELKTADDGLPYEEPRCTAFVLLGEPLPTPRCEHTADMFEQE